MLPAAKPLAGHTVAVSTKPGTDIKKPVTRTGFLTLKTNQLLPASQFTQCFTDVGQ